MTDSEKDKYLYKEFQEEKLVDVTVKAIPYCMWNNRGVGEMKVWLPVVRKF